MGNMLIGPTHGWEIYFYRYRVVTQFLHSTVPCVEIFHTGTLSALTSF
jgi:hypothetical protein